MIDLNCDLGELPELLADGTQDALLQYVTSANVACGAHAGDAELATATIRAARSHGVAVGAHPGYPDREHFGRRALPMSQEALADTVARQVEWLGTLAARAGVPVRHVKPHGALYNAAARDAAVAAAIATGIGRVARGVVLMGLAGSVMLDVFAEAGFTVWPEAFADRRYEPDGTLRARHHADSLQPDEASAAAQAVRIVREGAVIAVDGTRVPLRARTLCIHSDTPGAVAMARAVRAALR